MSQRIAWIGVGNLGGPMVQRLIDAGLRPLLFDANRQALEAFAEAADLAYSLDAIAEADIVFSTLPNDEVLTSVAGELAKVIADGAVFCDMSTVSPQASAEVAEIMVGKAYLRAPVSGSVSHARQGILTVLASGPEAAYTQSLSIFQCFAKTCFHVGAEEEARYLKLVINNLVGSTAALVAESLALAGKAGLDPATTLDVLATSAVASPLLKYKVEPLKARDFTPSFTTDMMIKDMSLVTQAAEGLGSPVPLAAITLALLKQHSEEGGADEDFFGLVKLLERQTH